MITPGGTIKMFDSKTNGRRFAQNLRHNNSKAQVTCKSRSLPNAFKMYGANFDPLHCQPNNHHSSLLSFKQQGVFNWTSRSDHNRAKDRHYPDRSITKSDSIGSNQQLKPIKMQLRSFQQSTKWCLTLLITLVLLSALAGGLAHESKQKSTIDAISYLANFMTNGQQNPKPIELTAVTQAPEGSNASSPMTVNPSNQTTQLTRNGNIVKEVSLNQQAASSVISKRMGHRQLDDGISTQPTQLVPSALATQLLLAPSLVSPLSSSANQDTMLASASKKKHKKKMMKKKKKMEKKHKEWKKGKKHKKKKYESKKKKGGMEKKKKGKKEKKKWGMEKKGHKKKGNFKKKKWGSKKKMKKGHKKGKKGHKMLKDKGHKKKGFKKVYHKEEWGKKKKWHDIKREKKWNTKQKKWKKKWHQEKGKKYKGKHMKKYHKKNKHGKKYKKEKKSKWKKHKGEKFKKGHKKKKEEYAKKKEGGKKKKMKKFKKEEKKKKKG